MHKRFVILSYVFLLLISCENKFEGNFTYGGLIFIKNGYKLIQGKEYEIIWNVSNLNSKHFYMDVVYFFEKDGYSCDTVIKLYQEDSISFKGKIFIPPKASWIYLSLSTPFENLSCPYSVRLPVYLNENKLEYGANTVALLNSKKENYLKFFFDERKTYPENYSIFVVRWLFELENNILDKDTINYQLKELERAEDSPTIDIIKLIGYSMVMDYSKHELILKKLAYNLKFTPVLNNWEVSGVFVNMLKANYDKFPKLISKIIENICKYNPFSHTFYSLVTNGILTRKQIIDPKIAIDALNKSLSRDTSYPLLLTKACILSINDSIKDSILQIDKLINLLIQKYQLYFENEDAYFLLQDNFHSLYNGIGLLPSSIRILANSTKKYLFYADLMRRVGDKVENNFGTKGLFYLEAGTLFEKNNNRDSALKYYFYSYIFLKNVFNEPYKKLLKLLGINNQEKFKSYLKILERKFSFPRTKFSSKFPLEVEYINGKRENITQIMYPKIIIFFSLHCTACEYLFKDLEKVKDFIKKKNVRLFFVSLDNPAKLKNHWIYSSFEVECINNPIHLRNVLKVGNDVPQILLFNSDNSLANIISGYGEKLDWYKLLSILK